VITDITVWHGIRRPGHIKHTWHGRLERVSDGKNTNYAVQTRAGHYRSGHPPCAQPIHRKHRAV